VDYSYVRGAAAGGDGINLNGGDVSLALPISGSLIAVCEFGLNRTANISGSGLSLTISTFMAGPRISLVPRGRLQPSFQVLLGIARASGTVFSAIGNTNGFAVAPGVRLDYSLTQRISLRLIEADYRLSTYHQNINDREKSVRLGAGIVARF